MGFKSFDFGYDWKHNISSEEYTCLCSLEIKDKRYNLHAFLVRLSLNKVYANQYLNILLCKRANVFLIHCHISLWLILSHDNHRFIFAWTVLEFRQVCVQFDKRYLAYKVDFGCHNVSSSLRKISTFTQATNVNRFRFAYPNPCLHRFLMVSTRCFNTKKHLLFKC